MEMNSYTLVSLLIIGVSESLAVIRNLEEDLRSKMMLFSKHHLQLGKVIGEG